MTATVGNVKTIGNSQQLDCKSVVGGQAITDMTYLNCNVQPLNFEVQCYFGSHLNIRLDVIYIFIFVNCTGRKTVSFV